MLCFSLDIVELSILYSKSFGFLLYPPLPVLTRDRPIMLFLPIMLCCSAHKIYLLCSKLCSTIRIMLSLLSLLILYMNKSIATYSRQFRKTALLECIYRWQLNTLHALFGNDCSIRAYQSFVAIFQKYFLLCWHYA